MNQITDTELIRDIQMGRISSYEILVKRYQRRLLSFAYRILHNESDAQEVVQDTFLKIYHKIDSINVSQNFSAFIFAVTKNTAISKLRSRKPSVSLHEYEEPISEDEAIYAGIRKSETSNIIHNAINSLSEKYRQILKLYYFDDLSYEEISRKNRIPLNTVRTLLRRARMELKNLLP